MSGRRITAYAAARGLGAAGHGVSHWWAQRVSAIALVPLALWLVFAIGSGVAADHATLAAWLGRPVNAILMILLLIAAFHHASLGLQVVAEDYIHTRARFVVVAFVHLASLGAAVASIAAVLLIAMNV